MTSDTNVTSEVLRTLHRIHRQLRDLQDRLLRGPRILEARQTNVKRLEEELARTQTETKAMRVAADEKQLQLKAGEEKVRKSQVQLNEAKSNVEYQGLKDQIAGINMTNSVLEDEILEAMEKVDQHQQAVAEAQKNLAKATGEARQAAVDVHQREPLIQADILRLEAELKEAEAALPKDFVDTYGRLVRARGDDAMAPLEGEFCSGCNQHVPLNMCSQVMLAQPVFCKSCGRLLYLPEGTWGK